jgi:hypothetical protein
MHDSQRAQWGSKMYARCAGGTCTPARSPARMYMHVLCSAGYADMVVFHKLRAQLKSGLPAHASMATVADTLWLVQLVGSCRHSLVK